jgi:hypothetical protein
MKKFPRAKRFSLVLAIALMMLGGAMFSGSVLSSANVDNDPTNPNITRWNWKSSTALSYETIQNAASYEGDDPDLPPGEGGSIDKDSYLRRRDDYIYMRRGLERGRPFDPEARSRAIRQMQTQETLQAETYKQLTLSSVGSTPAAATWTPIGPAPLPDGSGGQPVTGRVTAVVVDPTNSNKVYLGTAQGGVWRSLDGGTNWTSIFDNAESQAIGSLAVAPSNPSILYVGTGETNRSGDSFFGVGLYRVDNADTTANLVGPINPQITFNNGFASVTTNAFTGRSISQIIVHPTLPGTVFVSTSSGVAGSGSNGLGALGSIPPLGMLGVYRSTNADGPLAAITFTKLAVATGGAAVDVPATGNRRATDMAMDPGDPNNLIVGMFGANAPNDGGIYRTTNALSTNPTFNQVLQISTDRIQFAIQRDPNTGVVKVLAATSETPSTASCAQAATQDGVLRQSVDGGATWPSGNATATTGGILTAAGGFCGGQCFYNVTVAIDPKNANTIYLGGNVRSASCSGLMKRSTDGGLTFSHDDSGLHADSHALFIDPLTTPSTVFAGNDGGIWKRSADAGVGSPWINLNSAPLNSMQFVGLAIHPLDRNITLGGTQDNGTELQQTVSGTWENSAGGDGGYTLIDQSATDNNNFTLYHTFFFSSGSAIRYQRSNSLAAAAAGFWSTRGCSNSTPANGITCGDATLFYAPLALGPGTPNVVYLGSDRLYRSTDRGDSHTLVSQIPISANANGTNSPISTIGISQLDDNYRIVGMQNGQVWATSTGSSTLIDLTSGSFPANPNQSLTNKFVGRAIFDPTNKDVAYIAFSFFAPAGQGIWKITNFGAAASSAAAPNWVPAGAGIPSIPINSLAIDPLHPNHIYAGTDIGVYSSTDGGSSWSPYGSGLPRAAVFDVAIQSPNRILRIATHGRGMWETSLPGGANTVQFNANGQEVTETLNQTTTLSLTVMRTGDTSAAATIDYASTDGTALERSDYLAALGTLSFAPGETSKTITIFIVDDRYGETDETFSISLSNPVGCTLGAQPTLTVTIKSNETTNGLNPVKDPSFDTDFFVRQHYVDFFNREADAEGLAFWKNEIDQCPTQPCREVRRINVSAAFFVSIEFQETGYLIYKAYQAAFNSGEFLKLRDFLPDTQQIGRGVVIGQPGAGAQLESNKQQFFNDFVQRPEFLTAYPTSMSASQFVGKLNANTFDPQVPGSTGSLSTEEVTPLVGQLSSNPASPSLRAQVVRAICENGIFSARQFNKAFVLMQYFGYLRRNPNDPPEPELDFAGYNFWLGKLNSFNGNYIDAEMVKAFIDSTEYQIRFGP